MAALEDVAWYPVDEDEQYCPQARCPLCVVAAEGVEHGEVHPAVETRRARCCQRCAHVDGAEQVGQYRALNVEIQRIDAEGVEKSGPASPSLDVDYPYQQGEQRCCHAACREHECGRPYLFVERNAVAEQQSRKHHHGAYDKQRVDAAAVVARAADERSAQEADKHVGYRRQCAQKALGVEDKRFAECAVAVHVGIAYDGAVKASNDIAVGIFESVPYGEYHGIEHQESARNPWQPFVLDEHCYNGAETVAERQALEHAEDAQFRPCVGGFGYRFAIGKRPVDEF